MRMNERRAVAFLTVQSFFHRREVGGERRGLRFSPFSHSSTDARSVGRGGGFSFSLSSHLSTDTRSVGERRPIHRRVQYAN